MTVSPISIRFETTPSGASIVAVLLENLSFSKSSNSFEIYEQELFKEIRNNNTLEELSTDQILQSYRSLHWSYGIDPTKKRGSSEAVLRRVLQGKNLWRISNLVDIVNLASAYHKIPIGLVDVDKISGQLVIKTAQKGEIFQRIGGESITCRGRELVLADATGIVCYGYAIHDSERTKVTSASTRVLMLHYGTQVVSKDNLLAATNFTVGLIKRWIDCSTSAPELFVSPD